MWQTIVTSLALVGMLAAMLLALELGRRFGKRRMQQDATGAHSGNAALEGAVFVLLGLLIAFTFSGAVNRFDARRELLLKETNAIGTAWLRLDLLQGAGPPGTAGGIPPLRRPTAGGHACRGGARR